MKEEVNEHNQHHSYWKRLHHSFGFWIFLFLMFVAILYYIITVDFAFAPQQQMKTQTNSQTTP
jgi:deoxyadenosine/deoxycytidine kinase